MPRLATSRRQAAGCAPLPSAHTGSRYARHAPERTLVIGDTTHDLLMARHAGCEAVAVSYGAHPLHELLDAAPRAHAASVAELTEWLRCHA